MKSIKPEIVISFVYLLIFIGVLSVFLLNHTDGAQGLSTISANEDQPVIPQAQDNAQIIAEDPERLLIERIGIDLPVALTHYNHDTNTWPVINGVANIALETYPINETRGTTFIYGHNNQATFARTNQLQAGDKVTITTKSKKVFSYSYVDDEIVTPDDISLFNELDTPRPVLKLLTCNGVFSTNRRVMTFTLESVQ